MNVWAWAAHSVAKKETGLFGPSSAAASEAQLARALARLDAARPQDVAVQAPDIAAAYLLYDQHRIKRAADLIRIRREAAWALLCDRNGYIRALALAALDAPPTSPNRLIALSLRLNDWVPQVRAVALDAAQRLLRVTAPEVIAEAAPYLLGQRFAWRRWTEEAAVLDQALARVDVAATLARNLMEGRTGPLGRVLTHALRLPTYDPHLAGLATAAHLATVRAVALKTLLHGRATWPVGFGWAWIDKVYGLRRRVVLTESRPVRSPNSEALLRQGLKDRSAVVRRLVADALVARRAEIPDSVAIAADLVGDPDPAVRARGAFILKSGSPQPGNW